MRKHTNRLEYLGLPPHSHADCRPELVCPSCGLLTVGEDSAEGVAVLLRLLTRLANCGLDAGAQPLLHTSRSRS